MKVSGATLRTLTRRKRFLYSLTFQKKKRMKGYRIGLGAVSGRNDNFDERFGNTCIHLILLSFQFGFCRDNQPCDGISDEEGGDRRCEGKHYGHKTNDGRIDIQNLSYASANSGDFFVRFRAIEFCHGLSFDAVSNMAYKRFPSKGVEEETPPHRGGEILNDPRILSTLHQLEISPLRPDSERGTAAVDVASVPCVAVPAA